MEPQEFTSYLPKVRCTPEMKEELRLIANHSVARKLTDHIRFAIEQYVERELPRVESGVKKEPVNVTSN